MEPAPLNNQAAELTLFCTSWEVSSYWPLSEVLLTSPAPTIKTDQPDHTTTTRPTEPETPATVSHRHTEPQQPTRTCTVTATKPNQLKDSSLLRLNHNQPDSDHKDRTASTQASELKEVTSKWDRSEASKDQTLVPNTDSDKLFFPMIS